MGIKELRLIKIPLDATKNEMKPMLEKKPGEIAWFKKLFKKYLKEFHKAHPNSDEISKFQVWFANYIL